MLPLGMTRPAHAIHFRKGDDYDLSDAYIHQTDPPSNGPECFGEFLKSTSSELERMDLSNERQDAASLECSVY